MKKNKIDSTVKYLFELKVQEAHPGVLQNMQGLFLGGGMVIAQDI